MTRIKWWKKLTLLIRQNPTSDIVASKGRKMRYVSQDLDIIQAANIAERSENANGQDFDFSRQPKGFDGDGAGPSW